MMRHAVLAAFLVVLVAGPPTPASGTGGRVAMRHGDLPLSFEVNRGQTDAQVDYLARGPGYTLFLKSAEAVLCFAESALHLKFAGAKARLRADGLDRLPGNANYFSGHTPKGSCTNVPTYRKVAYRDVYPGIDLVYYGNQRQLEYDLVVAPGADPGVIALEFEGAEGVRIDARGDLVLGDVIQRRPIAYQEIDGARRPVASSYVLRGGNRVGLELGRYDSASPLVIDPVLGYSTYLGGSGNDIGMAIAVDGAGAVYVTGQTNSVNFPGAAGSPIQPALGSGQDAFVVKINALGTAIVYSTYFNIASDDKGLGIAVDGSGNALVTGQYGSSHGFVFKVNVAGDALIYQKYLIGAGYAVATDGAGNAYLTGRTNFGSFPVVGTSPPQPQLGGSFDAFVMKLDPLGNTVYSTFLGGVLNDEGYGIDVDAAGNAYVTGYTQSPGFPTVNPIQPTHAGGAFDAFVVKVNAAGTAFDYSTFLGGSGGDIGSAISVDDAGNAVVTGTTGSTDFPTASPLQAAIGGPEDAFVTKVNAAGSGLAYSTYLGGASIEEGSGVRVDGAGNAYVLGFTSSTDFPTASPLQATSGGGSDAFVLKLNAAGTNLDYSTYLGGSGAEATLGPSLGGALALDFAGNVYVTGLTTSADFPGTAGSSIQNANAGGADAFVTKIAVGGNVPPAFAPPTPPCDSVFDQLVDEPLQFVVRAVDQNAGDTVTLTVAGLPAGATLTPALPAASNPVATTLDWTPTAADVGEHTITFTASDGAGLQAQCTFVVEVRSGTVVTGSIFNDVSNLPVIRSTVDLWYFTVHSAGTVSFDVLSWEIKGSDVDGVYTNQVFDLNNDGEFVFIPSALHLFRDDGALDLGDLLASSTNNNALEGLEDGSLVQNEGSLTTPLTVVDSYLAVELQPGNYVLAIGGVPLTPAEAVAGESANPGTFVWDANQGPFDPQLPYEPGVNPPGAPIVASQGEAGDYRITFGGDLTVPAAPGRPPVFVAPTTPACGSTFDWSAGKLLTFDVQVEGGEAGDTVTLEIIAAPPGATTANPSLPAAGNPVSTTFLWTPEAAQAGTHLVTFRATDDAGHEVDCSFTVNVKFDSDGDGLSDLWETEGYTHPNGKFVDLPALGADPNRKDVFVQIDYMKDALHDQRPIENETEDAIQLIIDAFAAAPVDNPDGSTGITLHVLIDEAIAFEEVLGTGSTESYDWTDFDAIKAAHFAEELEAAVHYCVFAYKIPGGASGVSRGIEASDFIVALGGFTGGTGTEWQQAGTFMHELGHNLGLGHGGSDDTDHKPNYISIMNRSFQLQGLRYLGEDGVFDYSFEALPDLDENNLDETVGLQGTAAVAGLGTTWWEYGFQQWTDSINEPIVWDALDVFTETTYALDVTDDGGKAVLTGFDDWANLVFTGGRVGGGIALPLPQVTEANELTPDEAAEIALAPPTGLLGHAANPKVVLTWKPVGPKREASYRVYRASAGNPPVEIGTATESTFEDDDVTPGTTYTYLVTTVNALGVESATAARVIVEF